MVNFSDSKVYPIVSDLSCFTMESTDITDSVTSVVCLRALQCLLSGTVDSTLSFSPPTDGTKWSKDEKGYQIGLALFRALDCRGGEAF